MNTCSVCEKQIPEGATECSTQCMLRASSKSKQVAHKASSKFGQSMTSMLSPKAALMTKPSFPKILVKHRSFKNKNYSCGNVLLSFGPDGIAKVDDAGNNRIDIENAIKYTNGAMKIVGGEAAPVVKEAPIVEETKVAHKAAPVVEEAPKQEEAPAIEKDDNVEASSSEDSKEASISYTSVKKKLGRKNKAGKGE